MPPTKPISWRERKIKFTQEEEENTSMYYKPDQKVDDLNPTEDGEASEETHCASNKTKLGLSCHLSKKMIKVSHKMTIFVLLVLQFWFMRFDVVLQFHR